MRLFVFKIILRLVLFFSGSIILIFFGALFKNNIPFIIDKYKKEIIHKKDIKIVIFGDSEIHGAVDSKILQDHLNIQTNNLALGGQTVFINVLKIRDFLKYKSDPIIIFDYGSNDVSYRGDMTRDEGDLFESEGYKFAISNNFQFMNFEELWFFISKFPLITIQSFFKGIFQYNFILHSGVDLNNESKMDDYIKKLDLIVRSKNSIYNSKHLIKEDFSFSKLLELIYDNPSATFLILNPPEHKLNRMIYKKDSLKWLQNTSILKNFQNVRILNYKNFPLLDEDFENFSHLTISGKNKFSFELAKYLKQLNSN